MLTAPLPEALEQALAGLTGSGRRHARASLDLSGRYRRGSTGTPVATTREDVLAYAAARLPATYAATRVALRELAARTPWLRPESHLDLGSGPGTALWAARETWPRLAAQRGIDAEGEMRRLAGELGPYEVEAGTLPQAVPGGSFDLVTASYLIGELPPGDVAPLLERAWAATAGALVVVEPGTPEGYRRILAARELLVSLGGMVAAPCPHDGTCPLAGAVGDWCHFAVRVARSRGHRAAKEAHLGHEDEKLAYVAVTRRAASAAFARVLRHPQMRPGHVVLDLCSRDGRRTETVAKSRGAAYRAARKLSWGEGLEPGTL